MSTQDTTTLPPLQKLIEECERANATALRELGIGLIDLNALSAARAAIAAQAPQFLHSAIPAFSNPARQDAVFAPATVKDSLTPQQALNELVTESERLGLYGGAQQAQGVPAEWRLAKVSDGDIRVYGPDKETWLIRNDCGEGFYEFIHRFFDAMLAAAPQAEPVPCLSQIAESEKQKGLTLMGEPQPEREPERKPLTDAQIEKLREQTFSTSNPFCPCDSKTMRKAVWAAERAHGIGTKGD